MEKWKITGNCGHKSIFTWFINNLQLPVFLARYRENDVNL